MESSHCVVSMPRASTKACSSSKLITLSIIPCVFSNVYSNFLAAQGPMKTTLAVGSLCLMRRAAITMGDTEEEMASFSSGKLFSTKRTKAGQQEVVMTGLSLSAAFSLNSRASL